MKSKYKILNCLFILLFIGNSCEYDKIQKQAVPANVSYKKDVLPIFNRSCNSASCHSAGGIAPDLSKDNAYITLTTSDYIDTINPEKSEIIVRMKDLSKPMPTSGVLPDAQINIILSWIAKGAQDN